MCVLHSPDNTVHVLLTARALFQHDHGRQCCGPPRPQAEYNSMHGLSVLPAVYHTSIVILPITEDQRQASSSWWMKVLQVRQSQSSHICSIRLHIQPLFLLMGFWNLQGCKVHQTWTDVNTPCGLSSSSKQEIVHTAVSGLKSKTKSALSGTLTYINPTVSQKHRGHILSRL